MLRSLVVVGLLLITSSSYAQDTTRVETARFHFLRGQVAFQQSRWLECAHDFEASFNAIFAPELLYNIGLCYERSSSEAQDPSARLALVDRAIAAYSRYLREVPTASDSDVVRLRVADLRVLSLNLRPPQDSIEEQEEEVPPAEVVAETEEEEVEIEEETPITGEPPVLHPGETRPWPYVWTSVSASLVVASLVTAVSLSVAAQDLFGTLSSTCGQQLAGCSQAEVSGLVDITSAAIAMYVVSAVLFATTGVALGLEIHASSSQVHASLGYSSTF